MNFCANKQKGFTLLELLVVVTIFASLAALVAVSKRQEIFDSRADVGIAETSMIGNAAISYLNDTGVWPDEANACVGALNTLSTSTPAYLSDIDGVNAFGNAIATSCASGAPFQITQVTSANIAPAMAQGHAATTVIDPAAGQVRSSFGSASTLPALTQFLPRDGSLPMVGTLDMNVNPITNATSIETSTLVDRDDPTFNLDPSGLSNLVEASVQNGVNTPRVSAGASDLSLETTGRVIVDDSGANSGILEASDIYVNTRSSTVPLSFFMDNYVNMGAVLVRDGDIVPKPDCRRRGGTVLSAISAGEPKIIVNGGTVGGVVPRINGVWQLGLSSRADDALLNWVVRIRNVANGGSGTGFKIANIYCFYR